MNWFHFALRMHHKMNKGKNNYFFQIIFLRKIKWSLCRPLSQSHSKMGSFVLEAHSHKIKIIAKHFFSKITSQNAEKNIERIVNMKSKFSFIRFSHEFALRVFFKVSAKMSFLLIFSQKIFFFIHLIHLRFFEKKTRFCYPVLKGKTLSTNPIRNYDKWGNIAFKLTITEL